MASSQQADKAELEVQLPYSDTTKDVEVVSIELPAPQGWSKKFIPKKGGTGTPRRNEIVFIAPTGEEIKNKRQLDQYLKTHPDGPSSSEFDWGTGDTPRRSARLSSKPKATDSPESGSSRKRPRKLGPKKGETDEGESAQDEAAADMTDDDKTEDEKDVEMKDAEAAGNNSEEEKAKKVDVGAASVEYTEEKADAAKEQKEADEIGLSDGNQTQAGENKLEEVLKQEISQVPEETKKEEQPEENKVETGVGTVPSQGEEQPKKNKPEAVENPSDAEFPGDTNNAAEEKPVENIEHPGENKSEAVEKPSDIELPGYSNNATEEKPVENKKEPVEKPAEALVQPEADVSLVNTEKGVNEKNSANVEKEIEESKQGLEEPEKKVSSEEVGSDSNIAKANQEGEMPTKNQPVKPDGAPQEPDAAQPISC